MQLSFCFTAGINRARILTGLPEQLFAVLYPFCICIESVYRIIQSFKIVKLIVGMGLLLDAHQIPVGMKLYPGNESEKPVIRKVIDDLKSRNNISGKTIRVADKGLNCSENILHAVKSGDGYLFSKSVKQLPETEQVWVLLENDYRDVKNKKGDLLYRIKECVDDFSYKYTDGQGREKIVRLQEKRVAVYNPQLAKKQKNEISRQIEKAKILRAGQAKRSEYGDSAKFVTFQAVDEEGKKSKAKVTVLMNEKAMRPFQVLCKLKKTDIRCVVSYSEQSRFFEVLPLLVL